MSTRAGTSQSIDFPVGETSNAVVKPDRVFDYVENMARTESGGLTNIPNPTPWLLKANGSIPTSSPGGETVTGPVYGTTKGIFHCKLPTGKDLLVLHTGAQIWAFQGWTRSWRCIVGPAAASPLLEADLPDADLAEFPTQFVATPTGMVIVPQESRAFFWDGETCLPLGFDAAPAAPVGLGPENTSDEWWPNHAAAWLGINDAGYTMDGLAGHLPSEMHPSFRYGRLGTVSTPGGVTVPAGGVDDQAVMIGYLEDGEYRARAQWIGLHGDKSPWSQPSNPVRFTRQPAVKVTGGAPTYDLEWTIVDRVRKQVGWDAIRPGPEGTIARNLARTKDIKNSGTAKYFEVPLDSSVNLSAIATLPDNSSDFYPDNVPDSWLLNEVQEIDPVPRFRLAAMAFGRLWIANWPGGEGAVRASEVGIFGTFPRNAPILWPDPSGEVVGLAAVRSGLLIFTRTGTFLLDSATGLPRDISRSVGCVAPSSIVTLRSGMTVWLARDGFYGWSGSGEPTFLWESHRRDAVEISTARSCRAVAAFDPASGEYRCWLPARGDYRNTRCWTFDGVDWHVRTDVAANGVCVTNDARAYMIVCGKQTSSGKDGVFVLDRDGDPTDAIVRTGWIRSQRIGEKASIRRCYLLLRETGIAANEASKIDVAVRRDYRVETVMSVKVNAYPEVSSVARQQNIPGVYAADGSSLWGDGKAWRTRRVFKAKVDVDLASCDVFQLEITSSRRIEILGISFEEQSRPAGGANLTK